MNYKKLLFVFGCSLALSLGKVNAQSTTFNYTGSQQTWTVPCGVTSVTITTYGAQGSAGLGPHTRTFPTASVGGAGGLGGEATGVLTVTSGSTLYINVGGQTGWNGGGDTGTGYGLEGGFGGGATDVRYGGSALGDRVIVGGGGGGGGGGGSNSDCSPGSPTAGGAGGAGGVGANGGTGSSPGGPGAGVGGNGGTLIIGGSGGTGGAGNQSGTTGGTGSLGIGGNAGGTTYPSPPYWSDATGIGGGGGGGYYGGGGGGGAGFNGGCGAPGGGGGGGSSYIGGVNSGSTSSGVQSGNGSVTITWLAGAGLTVSANVTTNETCNGGNNGSASSTVTGGGTPYTYAWTGGGTNATVSGLTAGSYTVNVTDKCGNTASASVSITQPTAIVATITSTNILCNGGSGGSASSTVSGGAVPYTYAWTGGGTNSSISGLTAGTYNLNIQDANGCTGSATVTITQPTMLVVAANATSNVLCSGGSTGSASSTVTGGTMPYTYAWTGGGTTDTAVGLKAGTYTLSVQDANGCTGSAMVTITQPTALSIVKHATADNGSSNGKAWVTVSGGTMPYTYAWTGGNTTDSISGKAKGIYCCTVKDANGCVDSVCITIVSTLGINSITSDGGQITVYPNPNNGQFTIQSTLNAVSIVEVYNVLGEKVFSGNLNTGNNTINMNNQSNGIYLYRVISESSLASGEIISEGKISVQK